MSNAKESLVPLQIYFLFIVLAVSAIDQGTANIVNLHMVDLQKWLKNPENVYIGRETRHISASKWGNPFRIDANINRTKAIKLYEESLLGDTKLLDTVNELQGKNLGCWCAPRPCHGEILHRLAGNRPVYQ